MNDRVIPGLATAPEHAAMLAVETALRTIPPQSALIVAMNMTVWIARLLGLRKRTFLAGIADIWDDFGDPLAGPETEKTS